jgi:tetratricopeptide (TPR) repeat protein
MDIDDDILIQKYETLLYNKESMYFDSEEFEIIIIHYMSQDRYADALEALIHAELCHPDDIDLALHKVRIMMSLENFDRAFELLLILEEKANDLFEVNVYKGHIYTLNNEIEHAVKEFETAFEKNPDFDDEELRFIPELLIEQKCFEEALVFLHKFIDSGNANAKIFFNAGYCYDKISNLEEAEKYYEKALDEDPFNENAWLTLGILHLTSNNADKALDAFEYALSIDSEDQFALLCKSAALIKSGEYGQAIECVVDMLAKTPDDAHSLCCLAECYEQKQDTGEAEQCYIKAIGEEPDTPPPYWGLSRLMYAQGDIEGAIMIINKAIELEPDNEEYLYFRGQCLVRISCDIDMLENILHSANLTEELKSENSDDTEFMNKYKKAVFFYNIRDIEQCCKYLIETIMIDSKGLEMFFNRFPGAKDDARVINYLGKYFK